MILVDFNQTCISNLMVQTKGQPTGVDERLFRHMVLNSLRSYRHKFHAKYGELVICCESYDLWRKDEFKYYKAVRAKSKAESPVDWKAIYKTLNRVRDELVENFPYPVVQANGAEADDIIAILARNDKGPHVIVSNDKDFYQLHAWNIVQYSPLKGKVIKCKDPELFLKEHIIRGDKGDGVPNVLSPDDTFVEGKRQRPLSASKVIVWKLEDPKDCFHEEHLRNYHRNARLIDFDYIPQKVVANALQGYVGATDQANKVGRKRILKYFMSHRLKQLTESINQF